MNEIIWNNRFICIDEMSAYRSDLVNLGIMKVGDLIPDNNLFLHEDPSVQISPEQRFFLLWELFTLFRRIGKQLLDLRSVKTK